MADAVPAPTTAPPFTGGCPWPRAAVWPAVIALVAWLGVVACLDPAGSYPHRPEGPGLTLDEGFNVQQGVFLVEAIRIYGVSLLHPASWLEIFSAEAYLPDHPPLGRLWLGLHHHLWWLLCPPAEPDGPFVTACARSGSATAFALTIWLIGTTVSIWYGRFAGVLASLAYAILPRIFGHAHLAALESITNLTVTLSVLSIAAAWPGREPPSWKTAAWTGAVFGLALLTKMQAVLIVPALVVWSLIQWRGRAVWPITVWGGVGLLVFCAGWPWIWLDPWDHLIGYFRQTADRATIFVQLHGGRYTDRTVPRWYAPALFFAVLPFKVIVLAAIGCQRRVLWFGTVQGPDIPAPPRTSRETWLLIAALTPLLVFSLPGVPVYDGERLFMTVFPLWTVLAGRGCSMLWCRLQSYRPSWAPSLRVIIVGLMLLQGISLYRLTPCYLSYYNVFTLGLSGAETQGEELDYWGTAITRTLLEETTRNVPPGTVVAVAPVLHQFQLDEMTTQSPIIRRHQLQLLAYDPAQPAAEYVLLFRRQADLPPELKQLIATTEPLAAVRRREVLLGGLYRLPQPGDRNR